jgi:4-amino-4-deoxy-L-arabinose transferase-like glycosyltransferase
MFPSDLPVAILSPHVKSATTINGEQAKGANIRHYALLFVGCVLFHVAGTWTLPLIDRDEPRFAEASREMIERSDYIVPRFNNQVRLDKPPLTYWAQTASYRVFGQNDFAARLPSTIAAALIALSLLGWGLRIGGAGVGWWAAIIFTLSLQTFLHAKAAVADVWLVLFVTLAHWAGYELLRDRLSPPADQIANIKLQTSRWWWIFYLSLAFAFLAKGPIGWIPLLTVLSTKFFWVEPKLNSRFRFLAGSLLMLTIVALWGIPALIQTHGEFFIVGIGRNVVGRSFATMEGHGANSLGMYLLLLPFYFITVFASFFPWSIKIPFLTARLWQRRDKIDIYLLAGIAIIFVIFTFVTTKLPHYTLPAFPLLALLLARALLATNATAFLRNCATVSAAVYLIIALVVPPLLARFFFPAYQLFHQSRVYLQTDMQFGSVQFEEPSVVWYFRSNVRGVLTPLNRRRAADFMTEPGPRFVILPTSVSATLFRNHRDNWKFFSTRGFNIAKGAYVDLTLALKSE